MKRSMLLACCLIAAFSTSLPAADEPAAGPTKSLLLPEGQTSVDMERFAPSGAQVTMSPDGSGALMTIAVGSEQYPGVHFKPEDAWDLSAFGWVEGTFTNLGTKPSACALRIDGQSAGGEWGSNTEQVTVKPGETAKARVYFGYAYGGKPSTKLNQSAITKVVIFCNQSKEEQKVRIDSIVAGGKAGEAPPVKPENVRITPVNGVLYDKGVTLKENQTEGKEGAVVTPSADGIGIEFPAGASPKWALLKPEIGRWSLINAYGVKVEFVNTGDQPVKLRVKVGSNGGPTDAIDSEVVAPGATGVVEVPFEPAVPWLGIKDSTKTSWNGVKGTGTSFTSDNASSVVFSVEGSDKKQAVTIKSVVAGELSPRPIPDWVGKRPPVDGDWVLTFEENFDGSTVDYRKWNVYTENYWDKRSHFSKDNVIVEGGEAKLRYEKKTGFHNDDPSRKQTDYATGFLDTYGKWVQRYGYFEARMKLTKGPGIWPAFWLMPDRGLAAGPQWKRADTGNGAMEFDIMEHLGRWGRYRFNIALHWDGYGKGHQQTGSQTIYYQPDKDGYITSGLLWLPGLAVFYANGREVLRWETPRISDVPSDIMFTNVTGGWDNNGIDDSKMPDDFVIDYVRAWQRKDLASDLDGYKLPEGAVPGPAAPTATPAASPAPAKAQ